MPGFPTCDNCLKAGAACLVLDPSTGREIPRGYIHDLENRVKELEARLNDKSANSSPVDDSLDLGARDTNDISFARLMVTASRINTQNNVDLTTVSDPETVLPAILPPKKTAQEFLRIFFAQANSQLPILHRDEFVATIFAPIYGPVDPGVSLASDFTSFDRNEQVDEESAWFPQYKYLLQQHLRDSPGTITPHIEPPKHYHKLLYFLNMVFAISSSVHHLQYLNTISDSFKLAAMKYIDAVNSSLDQLEVLQGALLLALYLTMRPSTPGVWYVLGTALRICVDLGLHNEAFGKTPCDEFTLDKRRRLFWCTYLLDRQICFYLGRPTGIPNEYINTPFPSAVDDLLIIPGKPIVGDISGPSYKLVSLLFFEIRQLQCEVQRILYENSELPRRFASISEWKQNMHERLQDWHASIPRLKQKLNCDFNLEFFYLNYNHTILRLFGLAPRAKAMTTRDFSHVATAAKNLIGCYYHLYLSKSVNYTWAAVHNLFCAGTSYLYVVYNCEQLRDQLPVFDVKQVSQQCLTVMLLLADKCDAAVLCSHTFKVLTMAILKLKYNEVVHGLDLNVKELKANRHYVNTNLSRLLEDLSAEYTERSPKSFQWVPGLDPLLPQNDISPFVGDLASVLPLPVEDVQRDSRIYDLMQSMATEPIWDQFFTMPK